MRSTCEIAGAPPAVPAFFSNVAVLLRPEDTAADPWTSSRKIVEAYIAHTFPDLPLFAHYLLKRDVTGVDAANAGASAP